MRGATEQGHVIAWMVDKRDSLIVLLSLVATAWFFPFSLHAQEAKVGPAKSELDSRFFGANRGTEPSRSRPHEVTREYEVFRTTIRSPSRMS